MDPRVERNVRGEAPVESEAPVEWDDVDEFTGQDDFYDDLAQLYLVSGAVWPDGVALDQLPRLELSLKITDFFEELGPHLEK